MGERESMCVRVYVPNLNQGLAHIGSLGKPIIIILFMDYVSLFLHTPYFSRTKTSPALMYEFLPEHLFHVTHLHGDFNTHYCCINRITCSCCKSLAVFVILMII